MTGRSRWLLLIHQLPPQPDYFRVKVWRRLRAIGAATVKNSVYVLPNTPEAREDFEWLSREISAGGGEAILCEASFVAGLTDDNVGALFERRAETRAVEPPPAATPSFAAHRRMSRTRPATHPRTGTVWVTRRNIHVDRIASAWLIGQFIDPAGRFKFVNGTDYQRKPGEVRFDMFNAEYTHVGPKCTCEVLVEAFGLQSDAALVAISEIVHDIDCKEDAFGRAEVADTARALMELYGAYASDEERLEHGAVLFENLYGMLGTGAA